MSLNGQIASSHDPPYRYANHSHYLYTHTQIHTVMPLKDNFINESMSIRSVLMNWDFCEFPLGAAHYESFDESTRSHHSAFDLTRTPALLQVHFSVLLSA